MPRKNSSRETRGRIPLPPLIGAREKERVLSSFPRRKKILFFREKVGARRRSDSRAPGGLPFRHSGSSSAKEEFAKPATDGIFIRNYDSDAPSIIRERSSQFLSYRALIHIRIFGNARYSADIPYYRICLKRRTRKRSFPASYQRL